MPASLLEKANAALVLVVTAAGLAVMVGTGGGVVSIVQVWLVAALRVALTMLRTWNVWLPAARPG
jgi:hypothetical protein